MTGGNGAARNLSEILRLPWQAQRTAFIDLREADRPRTCTAADLQAAIDDVATDLLARGIRRGERVAILSGNRVEFVAAYFGIMRMGAVAVPVNHKLPADTMAHIFADSAIRLAFTDAARRRQVPAGVPVVDFDAADEAQRMRPGVSAAVFRPGPDDIAEILYTSGSTGRPKGVPLTHRGQYWAMSQYFAPTDAQPTDTTVVVAPLYHMNGLFFTSVALANRITIISLPGFHARQYLETVAKYRCTVLSGIPTMFALALREQDLTQRLDLSCVREVSIGSAPLTDALLSKLHALFPRATLKNGYGTTEAGPAVFKGHPDGRPTPPLALGYPIAGVQWRLSGGADADQGVLELRTPALMPGYLNLPEVTGERLRDGWYDTGDVMRRDDAGFFYFLGRNDDMFVCGGENIHPGEVEKLLERHPDVAQAVVVPAPDDIKGAIPIAFVVTRPGTRPAADEIRRYALAHGPAYAHPRFVVIKDELPVSGTHKIDRSMLMIEATRIARLQGRAGGIP